MKGWSSLTTPGNKRVSIMSEAESPWDQLPRAFALLLMCAVWFAGANVLADEGREAIGEIPETFDIPPPRSRLVVGERLSFRGRWFGIPVGHGWIEVREIVEVDGRRAYAVEAQGHSNDVLSAFYPIHDVIRSAIEVNTLRPLRFEKQQQEGHYRAEEIVTFDYPRLMATYRSLLNQSVKEVPIPPDVQDLLSAFYWLRTHPIDLSEPFQLPVYSDEKVYRVIIKPIMTLKLELRRRGTFSCMLLEPVAEFKGVFVRRGRVWLYLSADERRLPLYVKIATPWGPMTGVIDREALSPQ